MKYKVIKSVETAVLYMMAMYFAVYIFNHWNAWAGIMLALIVIVVAILHVTETITQNKQ